MAHNLEKELQERIRQHKYTIVTSSLIMFEGEGVYNSNLLVDKYGDNEMQERGPNRAFMVADDLESSADQETYDRIYEMCWQKAKDRLQDRLYGMDD